MSGRSVMIMQAYLAHRYSQLLLFFQSSDYADVRVSNPCSRFDLELYENAREYGGPLARGTCLAADFNARMGMPYRKCAYPVFQILYPRLLPTELTELGVLLGP